MHLVMQVLQRRNVEVAWVDPRRPRAFDTVVIQSRCDDRAYAQVLRWKAGGTRVIFDLCDNLFHYPRSPVKGQRRSDRLKRMLAVVDDVVATTETLADVIVAECPGVRRPVVIGDPLDDLSVIPVSGIERWLVERRAQRVRMRLQRLEAGGYTRLLWFGNHGSGYADSGMLHLAALRGELETLHRHTPLSLTVISNHRRKFRQQFSRWSLPCHYQPWHPASFAMIARAHDIALIPVQDNPFTRCKSDNRLVTAMGHGLAVVADNLPSYRPYAAVARVDGVIPGLQAYLNDPEQRRLQAEAGRQRVLRDASAERLADQWQVVLSQRG